MPPYPDQNELEYKAAFEKLTCGMATQQLAESIRWKICGMNIVLRLDQAGFTINDNQQLKAFSVIMQHLEPKELAALDSATGALQKANSQELPALIDFLHLSVLLSKLNMTGIDVHLTCQRILKQPETYPIKSSIRFLHLKLEKFQHVKEPTLSFTSNLLQYMKLPLAVNDALGRRFPPEVLMLCVSYIHSDKDLGEHTKLNSKNEEQPGDVLTIRPARPY